MTLLNNEGNQTNPVKEILIVDDHPIVRAGLCQLVSQQSDLRVCGQMASSDEASMFLKNERADLVLLDLMIKNGCGFELLKQWCTAYPEMKVLVVSMHDEELYAERVLRSGGHGYVMKHEATDILVAAVRKVFSDQIYLSPPMEIKLMHLLMHTKRNPPKSEMETLTDRELQVFHFMGMGWKMARIAEEMRIRVKTVETHREHIKAKFGAVSASALAQRACEWVQSQEINKPQEQQANSFPENGG